ncbi:MAG: MFS transporter, partial [Cohnella sp.]|nr:MFS transporter [Cohnella sp.]
FYLSEKLEDKGIDGIAKGGLVAIPLAALCTTSWAVGKWIGNRKRLMKWISVFGFALSTGCMCALALSHKDSSVFTICVLFAASAGLGAALPCLDSLLTEGIDKEQRGTVTSIYSSIRFLGVAIGPPLAALITERSGAAWFWLLFSSCGVAVILMLIAVKPNKV